MNVEIGAEIGRIRSFVDEHRAGIVRFLRDICAIPSTDGRIKACAERIGQEMEKLGVDEVRFDSMGNILGRMGSGPKVLLLDSHIDTVGIGDAEAWEWDPFRGKVERGVLFARGACDEKGSTPGMVYALRLVKELGLGEHFTVYYFGNMEEQCDGLAPKALVEVEGIRPDFVVIGEPTRMRVYRGHRGRIELLARARGRSCHAAMPEQGENAIYKMARFVQSVEQLGSRLPVDPFLGRATAVVSSISCETPSINAVPDKCTITIDRRTVFGETSESVLAELRALAGAAEVEIEPMIYEEPSYTGFVLRVEKFFPAWALDEGHPLVEAGQWACRLLFGRTAPPGRWNFSTNGTYWMGMAGIPSIGFGPGDEVHAHGVLDQVPLEDVVQATTFYALLPVLLAQGKE